MINAIIQEIEASQLRKNIPAFRPGDTVRVSVRIVEGDKERVQDYEGVVIARRGSAVRETFTVRRVSFGVGMERTFQVNSPRIEEIKIVRRGKVRRAKLYYLRNLRGKKARLVEKKGIDLTVLSANSTKADARDAAAAANAPQEAPAAESAPATT